LSACDNTIEPLVEDGGSSYAIHGFLDMRSERQVIRVESLRATVLADTEGLTGVEVVTSDLMTGQFNVWSDSLVTLDDGSEGVLYYADFKPIAGHEYRVQVGREGEIKASATTLVPSSPSFYIDPTRGDTLNLKQQVYLVNVQDQPKQLTMQYTVIDVGSESPQTIPISYGESGSQIQDGWTFDVQLSIDRFIVMRILNRDTDEQNVRLRRVSFSLTIESSEWTNQLTSTNLENAHGFFGSVGYYEYFWQLDEQSLGVMGFLDDQNQN
jgi:hypothetical protein